MRIRVLDLDGSLVNQPPVVGRLAVGRAELWPLRSRGPQLRLWASARTYDAFDAFWRNLPRAPEPQLVLLGSGDFHHLTAIFVAVSPGPLTVVHFDNHPDWCRTTPRHHCGSWVNEVVAMPHVQRVFTLGPCSDDLLRPDRKGGVLQALSEGRLEVYPWRHKPSRLPKNLYRRATHAAEVGLIRWRNLAQANWNDFLDELLDRVPTHRIWITVDKDVLSPAEAITNWDQGGLPLDHLIMAIRRLAAEFEIVGADICGEYAPIWHRNPFKYAEARLDQPRPAGGLSLDVNANTNQRLLSAFEAALCK